jgi:O-antigen ligase/polysaccharide polymerase Wzy-like membrane protein
LTSISHADLRFDLAGARPAHHPASRLADKLLHVTLYICILSSFFVYIEPAPYEFIAVIVGLACIVARVPFSPIILPLLILLLIRDASGTFALLQVIDNPDSVRFLAISFYLGLTAVMFACLFAQDTERRFATMRSAYGAAAVIAALLGTIGFFDLHFHFYPGLEALAFEERATGAFKDPNVLGCFLIPVLMWQIKNFIMDRVRPLELLACLVVFLGLLLAFSRAAWGTFLLALIMQTYFLFVTQTGRERKRIVFFVVFSAAAAVVVLAALLSIDSVRDVFLQRAVLIEEYDAGRSGSRFVLQAIGIREMLDHPLGMGPWAFSRVYNLVQHNTYLGTFLNHGWIGGAAYLALILLTLGTGFRFVWVRTPYQTSFIGTYVAFFALAVEGLVIDTDHFRHFYLLIGLLWGLMAATVNYRRRQWQASSVDESDMADQDQRSSRRQPQRRAIVNA